MPLDVGFAIAGVALALFGLLAVVSLKRLPEIRFALRHAPALENMQAAVFILDDDRSCIGTMGRVDTFMEMPQDWSPVGQTIADIVLGFATRGYYGPRISADHNVAPDFFLTREFEDIYLDTPNGRVIAVAVTPRASGGWVLTYTDMTRMKEQTRRLFRIQRELAESEAKAKRLAEAADAANNAKSAFLAAMSHEIRTPMNGIIGMAELMNESEMSFEQRNYVETIGHSAEALLRIINDILDFSKIEAGRMSLDLAPMNLLAACEDVLMLVSANARDKGLELVLCYDPGLPQGFVGDVLRMRQILINLVGNAIKFTLSGRVVLSVAGRHDGDSVTLEVKVTDTGIGIAEVDQERIFGEFDQADRSKTRRFEGTGLGLAITKRLVGLMNGTVTVHSELDVGTSFTVALSLPIESAVDQIMPVSPDTLAGERILVLSDVPETRDTLVDWLATSGVQNCGASGYAMALDADANASALTSQADLILFDQTHQSESALDAIRRFAPLPDRPKCLLLGHAVGQSAMTEDTKNFFDGHVPKPVLPSTIVQMIVAGLAENSGTKDVNAAGDGEAGVSRGGHQDRKSDQVPKDEDAPNILIADDNKTNRLVVERMLRNQPYNLCFAQDGREAVALARDVQPSLIFMDLSMPVMDGLQATAAIREYEAETSASRTPIIALTANTSPADQKICLDGGMDDFVSKPIRKTVLHEKINQHIEGIWPAQTNKTDAA